MLTSALSPLPLPHLFDRVRGHVLPAEWPVFAPDIEAILRLKRERNAVHPGAQLPDARRSSTASRTSSATASHSPARRRRPTRT